MAGCSDEMWQVELQEVDPLPNSDYYCPHCNNFVPRTTYFRHKRQFYDAKDKVWRNSIYLKSSEESSSTHKAQNVDRTTMDTEECENSELSVVEQEREVEGL